jgi:hypothetical protein
MERIELQQIIDFVHETEEMLVERDGDSDTWQIELTKFPYFEKTAKNG